MPATFICLSEPTKTAIGGGFTRDASAKWTEIPQGATVDAQRITTADRAADVFLDRIARRNFGTKGAAWGSGAAKDGTACGAQIYVATIGDGRSFTSVRFAVFERH